MKSFDANMTPFQLILFVAFINCTGAVINDLVRDRTIYEDRGFSYYCHYTQPVKSISLDVDGTTAVHCSPTTECSPNRPGYFFEPYASNETCMTFYIKTPEEGRYTCMDDTGSNKTDQLTIHKRITDCGYTTSVENTSDVDTQMTTSVENTSDVDTQNITTTTTTASSTTTNRSNDTIQRGYLILYVSIIAVIMGKM